MPTPCPPASPKGWCSSALGVSDAQPFNPTFIDAKPYHSGFARGGELPVQSRRGSGSSAEGTCAGCAPLMERDHLSIPQAPNPGLTQLIKNRE